MGTHPGASFPWIQEHPPPNSSISCAFPPPIKFFSLPGGGGGKCHPGGCFLPCWVHPWVGGTPFGVSPGSDGSLFRGVRGAGRPIFSSCLQQLEKYFPRWHRNEEIKSVWLRLYFFFFVIFFFLKAQRRARNATREKKNARAGKIGLLITKIGENGAAGVPLPLLAPGG